MQKLYVNNNTKHTDLTNRDKEGNKEQTHHKYCMKK